MIVVMLLSPHPLSSSKNERTRPNAHELANPKLQNESMQTCC